MSEITPCWNCAPVLLLITHKKVKHLSLEIVCKADRIQEDGSQTLEKASFNASFSFQN